MCWYTYTREVVTLSYHDVKVIVNGVEYVIFNNYGIELTCNKVGGWSLWKTATDSKNWQLIGGEYNNDDFKIVVGEHVIFETKKNPTFKED